MIKVSFKVAKTLREAGYPQEGGWYYSPDGRIGEVVPDPEDYLAPTYLEVWLWLWREKGIEIVMSCGTCVIYQYGILQHHFAHSDPEKAIIAAIDCIVDNKLL